MNIIITGSAGFIGYHLTKSLLKEGHNILGIDNLNDYYDVKLKESRLATIDSDNFKFIKSNINDIDNIEGSFDLLINLAAQAGVRVSKDMEKNYIDSNVSGFKSVCDFCEKRGIAKLIYASSSSIYHDNYEKSYAEGITPEKPKSFYGLTKLFNEQYAELISKKSPISIVGLRFFSVYGPWGRPDMAYFLFTKKIKNKEIIRLHNNGSMARDMTYIDDIINGIKESIKFNAKQDVGTHDIFNLGNDEPIETSLMLCKLESLINIKATKENFTVYDESAKTHANLSKSKKILNYSPKTKVDDGLRRFIDWYEAFYEEN